VPDESLATSQNVELTAASGAVYPDKKRRVGPLLKRYGEPEESDVPDESLATSQNVELTAASGAVYPDKKRRVGPLLKLDQARKFSHLKDADNEAPAATRGLCRKFPLLLGLGLLAFVLGIPLGIRFPLQEDSDSTHSTHSTYSTHSTHSTHSSPGIPSGSAAPLSPPPTSQMSSSANPTSQASGPMNMPSAPPANSSPPPPTDSPPPLPMHPICYNRHVLAPRLKNCRREKDDDGYTIVSGCVFTPSDCRSQSALTEADEACGEVLLPIGDYWSTSLQVCNNDCSAGVRIECPVPSEDELLQHAQISRDAWDAYVIALYDADEGQLPLLPRIDQVDMVYTDMLRVEGAISFPADECPSDAWHPPTHYGQPHISRAVYYKLAPAMAGNDSWLEVTHCASHIEAESTWFYILRGSGIFVNVGTTIIFRDHPEAAEHFGTYGDVTNVPAAAAAAGYDSIQFWEHCEGCICSAELVLTAKPSGGACLSGVEYRTGPQGSQPCTCQEKLVGNFGDGAGRPECITCSSFADRIQRNYPQDDD